MLPHLMLPSIPHFGAPLDRTVSLIAAFRGFRQNLRPRLLFIFYNQDFLISKHNYEHSPDKHFEFFVFDKIRLNFSSATVLGHGKNRLIDVITCGILHE